MEKKTLIGQGKDTLLSEEEGGSKSPSDTKAITHHQQTNAQTVTKKQLFWKTSPCVLLLSTMLYGLEDPFGQLGSAVLGLCPPPSLSLTPSLLTGMAELRNSEGLGTV